MRFQELTAKFIKPSTTALVCVSLLFITVFTASENGFQHLFTIFYKSEFFAYLGCFSIVLLVSRMVKVLDFSIKSTEWFENRKRIAKSWPTEEEEVVLESLFYSGINFDELYKFVNFANEVSFIAFTENSQATVQNYTLLARNDIEKYWLSYFRFSQREVARIKILYLIISNFMEVLTDNPLYKKELKEQAKADPELKNIDTEKLLIAIISKDDIKKINLICEKYYKMIIDKRIEGKS